MKFAYASILYNAEKNLVYIGYSENLIYNLRIMIGNKFFKLIISLFICYLSASIGSIFTMPAINSWYALLNKPFFNPPNWLFAPVWSLLYTLMGISLYIIWSRGLKNKIISRLFWVFVIHLIVNILWSVVFFGFHSIMAGFLVIVVLWLMILYLIINLWKISKSASILLMPYLAWVSFATLLNYFLMILN